jgi:hypothetical protein
VLLDLNTLMSAEEVKASGRWRRRFQLWYAITTNGRWFSIAKRSTKSLAIASLIIVSKR